MAAMACSKAPTTYQSNRVDSFTIDSEDLYTQASQVLQADYMFVVDVSASMGFNSGDTANPYASKRAEFMGGLNNFVSTLQAHTPTRPNGVDYRIGFIDGNVQAGRTQDLAGRGFYKNILINSIMPQSQQTSLIGQLQDIGQTLNENTSLLLAAADEGMRNQQSAFVRAGSQLVYLFVSDSDDQSDTHFSGDNTTSTFGSKLINYKGSSTTAPAFVNARAIVAGTKAGNTCRPDASFGESTGRRLAETAAYIENQNKRVSGMAQTATSDSVSHCILRASSEFPTLLETLAQDVSKPTNLFALQVANVDVNSIKVYTKAQGATTYTLLANSQWQYLSSSNSVKLVTTPPASTSVKLNYDQFFNLSGTPTSVSSIQVSANGAIVLADGSNGYTYDAANNRIIFHGTNLAQMTRIEVSYQ